MWRAAFTICLAGVLAFGAQVDPPASRIAGLARVMREAGLDAGSCYRVRDLSFSKEDLRFYLTDGFLIFGRPVEGRIVSAVFVASEDTGDAEVLVFPPSRSERASLSRFAETPNLNEHFLAAAFLFSDNTASELMEQLRANEAKPAPEKGALLADGWGKVIENLTGSVDMRLIQDHLNRSREGLFYSAITTKRVGNIDLIYDPQAREQIMVGQVVFREQRSYFDVWTNFTARSFRAGRKALYRSPLHLSDYRINADFDAELRLKAVTRCRLTTSERVEGTISVDLSRRMQITGASIAGKAVEVYARESLRSDLLRASDNGAVLLGLAEPLEPGKTYELEIAHEGNVVLAAGNNVFFVGSRTGWYPSHGTTFATFEITFRYPKLLNMVSNGVVLEDKIEGEFHVTRTRTPVPIRFAGFNLGEYVKASAGKMGYSVEVYANRNVENALRRQGTEFVVVQPPGWGRGGRRPDVVAMPAPAKIPNPPSRHQELAAEIASALEFMASHFGPMPLKTLTVSPIPGTFGQGFPGLLYLSTLAYLSPSDRPSPFREETQQLFYSDILHAHETAHQWWGNVVTSASYQDEWLMEALANYSALMYLEKRRGRRALDSVLQQYKEHLLAHTQDGRPLDAEGPIIWGSRLASSQAPGAWRVITYEKGSWILHMLRAQLGDAAFLKMLGQLTARYRSQAITTEQFRMLAQQYMPEGAPDRSLQGFFDQWVYGTGIPALQLSHSVLGKAPNVRVRLTVKQSGVDDDFSTVAPVDILLPGKRTLRQWVRTSSEPVSVTVVSRAAPLRVELDPQNVALRK